MEITNDFNHYLGASVTADGSSLVTVKNVQSANLFVAPIDDLSNIRQLTDVDGVSFKGINRTPAGKIVYASNVGGERDIFLMNVDGSEVRQITNNRFSNFNSVQSPMENT